jgi:branched-chain amino acid transport system permease protein
MHALELILGSWLSITAILLALSFIVGRIGIWSVGHLAFFTLGQLLFATAATRWDLGLAASIAVVILGATAVASAVGAATFRLETDYFVVLSLALAWCVDAVTLLAFGARGATLPRPFALASDGTRALVLLGLPLLGIITAHVLVARSSLPVVFAATRQDPRLAATLGIPTYRIRILTFAAASVTTAVVGAAHALLTGATDPALGDVGRGILLFCLLILGGVDAPLGVIAATVLYVGLPRVLEYVLVAYPTAAFYAANITDAAFAAATYVIIRVRHASGRTAFAAKTTST